MEIAPIAGIRVMAQPKADPVDTDVSARFDIEAPAKPGDDTYTSNRRKAAGAEENEDESDPESEQAEEILDDDFAPEPAVARKVDEPDEKPRGQISYFA